MPTGNRRACVIGAGISGLVSAKVLAGDGFEITVFEKEPALGGVWAPSRTYPGLHTNNPKETYCFSDHPYPDTADIFPSAEQVRAYLRSFAERFRILPQIELNTEVTNVAKNPANDLWQVTVRKNGQTGAQEMREFEFIIICSGVYSKPRLPEVNGLDRFEGLLLHSSQFTDPEQVKGKRVVVVGAGKSAADCASWAARGAASSTLLFRRAQWMLPRYFLGFLNSGWVLATRAIEFLMPYYRRRGLEAVLHGKGRPLVRMVERAMFALTRLDLGIPAEMVPKVEPLPKAFESSGVVADFYKLVRDGSIKPKKGSLRSVTGRTLQLDTGETLEADIIVFATGWNQEVPFLADSIRRRIQRDGRFHLFRGILPPEMQTLGFVGYSSSNANQMTSELCANWLSEVFLGRMRLPSVVEMEDDIASFHRWIDHETPSHRGGYSVGPFIMHHIDDLVRDMGLSTRRTNNFLTENFWPVWPSRYATIAQERRDRGLARPHPRRIYLSSLYAAAAAAILMLFICSGDCSFHFIR